MYGIELPRAARVAELVERFGGHADRGALDRSVVRLVSPDHAERDDDLVVVTRAEYASAASRTSGVILCAEALASRLPEGRRFAHPHAEWVLAELCDSARVVPEDCSPEHRIGKGAVIQQGAILGPGCVIGENAVILRGAVLGARVKVGPLAVIGREGFGWVQGPNGAVRRMPQLGGVVIEDDVEIGPLCTIDAGTLGPTRIGRGAKLDAHVHVGHNVEIGPGCLVAAQVGFAGSVRLGEGVWVGGQAGFKDHVSVGKSVRVAAKSGVIGDVPDGMVVAGFPAVARMRWLRAMSKLLGRTGRNGRS